MALLPALVLVGFLWLPVPENLRDGSLLGFLLIVTLFVIILCSVKLAVLHGTRSTVVVIGQAFCYFLCFLIFYAILGIVLTYNSCAAVG